MRRRSVQGSGLIRARALSASTFAFLEVASGARPNQGGAARSVQSAPLVSTFERRFPIGAEFTPDRGTHFRVWAPARQRVSVVERQPGSKGRGNSYPLEREPNGYHSGWLKSLEPGSLYSFQLDAEAELYPDPASRFQPEGPHGPSQVINPRAFRWSDQTFNGLERTSHAIYECHIGTFTKEGTYAAATEQLAELSRLGITILELMPLADFPGRFGWGYDGVNLYAPTRLYGSPEELRALIDRAHALGLCVILDVVYNHVGPVGNYLRQFTPDYFSRRYENEWGEPLNFDDENSLGVREFFVQNARYWVEEFHFDGLRLDATQSIFDASSEHVVSELVEAARKAGRALGKRVFITAENETQEAALARSRDVGGKGCDSLWNDDFHHSARVALTGRHEAYYNDYRGTAQELLSALKWGYLFQGQHYFWQKNGRGQAALDLTPESFVTYIQNHDQVANSATGGRIQTMASADAVRAMTALMLLSPPIPMLFQGQEFASSAPFLYFADCEDPKQAELVNRGRREFLSQFPSLDGVDLAALVPDASSPATFERCKLDFRERETHRPIYALHRELLRLRHEDPVFRSCSRDAMHGSVLSTRALLLRFFSEHGDRLLLCNLGDELELRPAPEPLLVPPTRQQWTSLFSSDDPSYGGLGAGQVLVDGVWRLPARSTQVFRATLRATSKTEEKP